MFARLQSPLYAFANCKHHSAMSKYRFILEPYKGMNTRYACPECASREKTFVRYIDTQTGEHLHTSVGRCNRETNCGYHYTPKQYFEDNRHLFDNNTRQTQYQKTKPLPTLQPKPVSFIPFEPFEKSLQHRSENNFVKFLYELFDTEITNVLINKYFIGTSKHWDGATVFWQIDIAGKLRTGKIMLYNRDTGKRIKEKINWVHSVLKIENFNLKQCFFGEHLLKGNTKPVAIVESEKTAVIASVYLPQFVWLAVGSLTNLSAEKCKVLQGRIVILFPDLNGFEKWSDKAKEISRLFPGTRLSISDLLERKATEAERQQGLDLADYLIRFDYKEFQQQVQPEHQQTFEPPQQAEIAQVKVLQSVEEINACERTVNNNEKIPKLESWDLDITELGTYFKTATLPTDPVRLNQCSTITDVYLFVRSHLSIVETHNGNKTFLPYLDRLKELKQYLIRTAN